MAGEESYLIEKDLRCKVCGQVYKAVFLKNGRVRRKESDQDLRPRAYDVDILKYEATSCPCCGYTAMYRYVNEISDAQIKMIKEKVCTNFKGKAHTDQMVRTYDEALDLYEDVLVNAAAKHAKHSETALACLYMSWLLRAKAEELPDGAQKDGTKAEEDAFYEQAFDEFQKAEAKEYFPMCGMDETMIEYILACIAFHFKRYEVASRYLSRVLGNRSTLKKLKDRAIDLKQELIDELKQKTKG